MKNPTRAYETMTRKMDSGWATSTERTGALRYGLLLVAAALDSQASDAELAGIATALQARADDARARARARG